MSWRRKRRLSPISSSRSGTVVPERIPGQTINKKKGTAVEVSKLLHALLQDESGITAIEYALIGTLIAMAIVTTVAALGLNLKDLYAMVAGKVQEATRN